MPTRMDIRSMIVDAGKRRVMVRMDYQGVAKDWIPPGERMVEPYSFRNKGGQDLFYGFCHKDGRVNSFRLDRIRSMELTDQPYEPRWEVEF